jgi:hypothetical protein
VIAKTRRKAGMAGLLPFRKRGGKRRQRPGPPVSRHLAAASDGNSAH